MPAVCQASVKIEIAPVVDREALISSTIWMFSQV